MATINSAIKVKYAGPTDYKGSRWIVSGPHGRITVGYDHALNTEENILNAAVAYRGRHCPNAILSESILEVDSGYAVEIKRFHY